MAKMRNILYSTRVKIKVLHEEGCRCRQIATRRRCRHTTARMIIKKLQQSSSLKDEPKSGRARCSTARDDCVLLRLYRTDRKKTAPELKRRSSQSMGDFWNMVSSHVLQEKYIDKRETKKIETSVGWRTPSVDTSTLGEDSMVRWVQVPAISSPIKCQSHKETWGRICTCLHWGWGTLFSYEWGRRRESAGWGVF